MTPPLNGGSTSSPNLFKCSLCRLYGFTSNDVRKPSDLTEHQPSCPSFINHSMRLISNSDLDEYTEQSGLRGLAFRTDGISAFQTVVSTVLLSPSYSPAERVTTTAAAAASIFEQYRIYNDELYGVLSEPFHSLDGLTPLEHEILRWDPIWEGEGGSGIFSFGMEMIQFLIEHWRPRCRQTGSETGRREDVMLGDSEAGVERGTDAYREELLSIARSACLRRLATLPFKYHNSEEDITNSLFQRIVRLVWFTNPMASGENDRSSSGVIPSATCAGDFSVSLAYDPYPADPKGKLNASGPAKDFSEGSDFTALISIPRFSELLRDSKTSSYTPPSHSSTSNQPIAISYLERANRRPHPYTRPILENEAQMTRRVPRPVTPSLLAGRTARAQRSETSSCLCLVDFIAVHRAWTLGVGYDMLQLTVHGQGHRKPGNSDLASNFHSEEECTPESERVTHAEVRLVTPALVNDAHMSEISEHVFTFPNNLPMRHYSDAKVSQGETYRVSPCFLPTLASEASHLVTRFDDQRILHSGELMLELRVRMQPLSVDSKSTTDFRSSCTPAQVSGEKSDAMSSAWSVISTTHSGTSFVELSSNSDLHSYPPDSLVTSETNRVFLLRVENENVR